MTTTVRASASAAPISRFGGVDDDTAVPQVKSMFEHCRKHFGHVPNWIRALGAHPGLLRRFSGYYEAIFNPAQGRLSMAERELIATIVSNQNHCTYCTLHHTGGLAQQTGDGIRAQRIAHNYREVDLSTRERVIADFAMKVTVDPAAMDQSDFELLRTAGLSDEEIFEVLEIAAFFSFSNRLATPLAIVPDDELFAFQRSQ
jgi:uncharacterized peroxidase-related enzyme